MRTLGLDLGTNSIGWAIIESEGRRVSLIDKGVCLCRSPRGGLITPAGRVYLHYL